MPLPFNGYPGYPQNFNNPYLQQQQQQAIYQPNYAPQQSPNVYYFVNGIEGAKAYQVPAGKSVLLMDSENQIFYHKSANDMGQATIKIYKFEEVEDQTKPEVSYMTKEEVEEMIRNALSFQKTQKKTTTGD